MATETVHFHIGSANEKGRAEVARPSGVGPFPAVLVLHELLGLNQDIERIASRFAEAGYVAMAPDYFGDGFKLGCILKAAKAVKSGSGDVFDRLDAARRWLADRPEVDSDRIGIVGFCMGGGFAILHAARSNASAVAMFYGDVPKDHGALTGSPPCVGGFGGKDRVFGKLGNRLESHLDKLGVEHDIATYPGAGHSFMGQDSGMLTKLGKYGPMRVGYNPDAAEASWSRMLAFFETHI